MIEFVLNLHVGGIMVQTVLNVWSVHLFLDGMDEEDDGAKATFVTETDVLVDRGAFIVRQLPSGYSSLLGMYWFWLPHIS